MKELKLTKHDNGRMARYKDVRIKTKTKQTRMFECKEGRDHNEMSNPRTTQNNDGKSVRIAPINAKQNHSVYGIPGCYLRSVSLEHALDGINKPNVDVKRTSNSDEWEAF